MFLNKGKLQELKLTDLPKHFVHICEQQSGHRLGQFGKDFDPVAEQQHCECPKESTCKRIYH